MTNPLTAYTPENVRNTAASHDELANGIDGRLKQCENHVHDLLRASGSGMTDALNSTFQEFSTEVKQAVVKRMHDMAEEMRDSLSHQEGANQDAAAGVKKAGAGKFQDL